jgi:TetR/AcrR family transcriptional repressor of mexJK operon
MATHRLVMSIPLNQAMLLGEGEPATSAELERYADGGVRAFLAAYGKRGRLGPRFVGPG